ncbi:MAG TPA: hypothetical protein VD902_07605 [Symbiobacteriaceae bacterium]|nr:hypothetical protein [Symbiobacteriaceae bacterium]
MTVALNVVVRGPGSIRSPSEHVAAIMAETEPARVILYGVETPEYETVLDGNALSRLMEREGDGPVLVYGSEQVLIVAPQLAVQTVWITLGAGANAVRELWRMRGAHSWLAKLRLSLLLEDGAIESQLRRSALAAVGRVTHVVTLPPRGTAAEIEQIFAESAVAAMPAPGEGRAHVDEVESVQDEVEPAEGEAEPVQNAAAPVQDEAEPVQDEVAPLADEVTKGVRETMAEETMVPTISRDQETEKALLSRYTLVLERRSLVARMTQLEDLLNSLLKETFVMRFAVNAETAAAFEDLTRKLAETAAEFKRVTRQWEQVEQQLEQLSWLRTELGL